MIYLDHLQDITFEVTPWLLFGLLAAGLVKAWMPEDLVARWLGGRGAGPIIRGALVGAPLPLCSCSVIPIALGLRRNGASKPATVAFLVSTPETGVDSVILSWTLLGPFMTIARPVTAILSAIFSGFMTLLLAGREGDVPPPVPAKSACASSCCGSKKPAVPAAAAPPSPLTAWSRTRDGMGYALTDLWDDIAPWIAGGILVTALVQTWIPPGELHAYTDGSWLAMVLMVAASMPVYVCATASTPMAAAMLYSGLSPGMTLAFLIAGPATNLAPLALIRQEMGWRTMTAYLLGIGISAVGLGMLTDLVAGQWQLAPAPESILAPGTGEWLPVWLAAASTLILAALSLRSLRARRRSARPAPLAAVPHEDSFQPT